MIRKKAVTVQKYRTAFLYELATCFSKKTNI